LGDILARLYKRPEDLKNLSKRARRHVRDVRYSWDRIAEQFLEIFEQTERKSVEPALAAAS
jgi:glycosyltransferase involved in cell wall biosynthesis